VGIAAGLVSLNKHIANALPAEERCGAIFDPINTTSDGSAADEMAGK
jgi:hypothetical protein